MSTSVVFGSLEAIYQKRARKTEMDAVQTAALKAGRGMVGSSDQGGKRQVTLLDRAAWDAMMAELGAELDPAARRANLVVRGLDFRETRGRVLRVGGCRLRIWGETRPCERMDEAVPGLRAAMQRDWRGGVFAEILDDGLITVGDPVHWVDQEGSQT